MSNVESKRVISNSRRTVGLLHTSAIRPPARVMRRSALSSTLNPVESMNSTALMSITIRVRPAVIDAVNSVVNSGAVETWISPSTATTVVSSSMALSLRWKRGSARDTSAKGSDKVARAYPRQSARSRQPQVRSQLPERDPAVDGGPAFLGVHDRRHEEHVELLELGAAQLLDDALRQLERPAPEARALGRALPRHDRPVAQVQLARHALGDLELGGVRALRGAGDARLEVDAVRRQVRDQRLALGDGLQRLGRVDDA